MTVSLEALKSGIRPFFRAGSMPKSAGDAVRLWAQAYCGYAQAAVAGGVIPATLSPVPAAGKFFDALEQTLTAMWMSVAWVGPGLVGKTTTVPPLVSELQRVGRDQVKSRDPDKALSAIADALHTYTLGIAVTITAPSGASSVAPLT